MSLFDKVGNAAMDALSTAGKAADEAKRRLDPLIDKSELASRLRDRIAGSDDDLEVPMPEPNVSPFAQEAEEEDEAPLADRDKLAQIYGRGTDPWTGRALQLLTDRGVEHDFADLEADGGLKLESRLVRETQQNDGPYIFLRGEFVGGFNALHEIDRLGQLEERLKPADERGKGGGRTRIVIAERGAEERPPGEIGNPTDRK